MPFGHPLYPDYFATFISRIRRSRQSATTSAGMHRLKPGLQDIHIRTIILQRSAAGSGVPGSLPRPWQACHRLKPGLPDGPGRHLTG
jgi:hypothetical protein